MIIAALSVIVFLFGLPSRAAVLDALPNAMAQGGMVHIDVVFTGNMSASFTSTLEFGGSVVPPMKPLTLWSPGDTINPSKAYYDEIDPTQSAMMFSSRWGFRLDTDNSVPVPTGTSLGIRMTSCTPGLGAYFYNSVGSGTFQPVFLTTAAPHDYVLWSGTMWHPYFTMPNTTPHGTTINATFEFFLANQTNSGNVDWTTTAGYEPGYTVGTQTITWTAIPEPSVMGLFIGASMALAVVRLRRGR